MTSEGIEIKGIEKERLLHALWDYASFSHYHELTGQKEEYKPLAAGESWNIDYHCGKCIKCNLSGDTVDPSLYDNEWGKGAFQEIVNTLGTRKKPLPACAACGKTDRTKRCPCHKVSYCNPECQRKHRSQVKEEYFQFV